MRILMISDVYFPRINGVSTSILTYRDELLRQGHHVTLIAPHYGPDEAEDGDVIRIASRQVRFDPEDRLMRSCDILALEKRLASERFDVVHIQTPFVAHYLGVKLARMLGLPSIETYHTFFEEYLYHYVPILPRTLLRVATRHFSRAQCNSVAAVVVPSRAMREVLLGYGVRRDITALPTGVPPLYRAPDHGARFRRLHGISPDRPVLVYVGRIAFEKNIGFLLEVVAKVRAEIPDILLLVAGEGPALDHLKRRTRRLEIDNNVLFVGYLSRKNGLSDCYQAGDVFVFASRTETQGLVLLEAMQLGVPVVSTAIMGTKDILRNGHGALIVKDDLYDFTAKVVLLLRDPAQRRFLGQKAVEHAKHWAQPTLTRRLVALYGRLANQQQALRETASGEAG